MATGTLLSRVLIDGSFDPTNRRGTLSVVLEESNGYEMVATQEAVVTNPDMIQKIVELRVNGQLDASIFDELDSRRIISKWSQGNVTIVGDDLFYKEQRTSGDLAERIIEMVHNDDDPNALINFMERLQNNPSYRAVKGLFAFLTANNMGITPDGYILAYKIVREDFTDIYTGRFDNSVGKTVEMPRNNVDEDPEKTCSTGLHVCAYGYLGYYGTSYGSRLVIVKIDPADVVAVPRDYNNAKMRVSKYVVVAEVGARSDFVSKGDDVLQGTVVSEDIFDEDGNDCYDYFDYDDYDEWSDDNIGY